MRRTKGRLILIAPRDAVIDIHDLKSLKQVINADKAVEGILHLQGGETQASRETERTYYLKSIAIEHLNLN